MASSRYPLPSLAVDLVAVAVLDARLQVLWLRRSRPPFASAWALPGGFVRVTDDEGGQGEDLDEAARRILARETQLPQVDRVVLRQAFATGPVGRDPRTRVVSVVQLAFVPPELAAFVRAGTDADEIRWAKATWPPTAPGEAAFDHLSLVERALIRARATVVADEDRAWPLLCALAPARFSHAELRATAEALADRTYDGPNFRRRVTRAKSDGFFDDEDGERVTGRRRASLLKAGPRSLAAAADTGP